MNQISRYFFSLVVSNKTNNSHLDPRLAQVRSLLKSTDVPWTSAHRTFTTFGNGWTSHLITIRGDNKKL